MYQPINLSRPPKELNIMEEFSIDFIKEDTNVDIFTEAVFANGRSIIQPIEEQFQVIKDILDEELSKDQNNKKTRFDPEKFVKNLAWKELEDRMTKIFGFRNIEILHWNERYLKSKDEFETMEFNCYTFPTWRYPIDGLVTDKGFYDSTRSINTTISYSLGIIKKLTAGELTAIFLHEFGHNIDPALVDINYVKTNILSKYLTDRKNKLNNAEKKMIEEKKKGFILIDIIVVLYGLGVILALIINIIKLFTFNVERAKNIIKDKLKKDKEKFDRQSNFEAFADNFARMYGYGPQLVSALTKASLYHTGGSRKKSRFFMETLRQMYITEMILSSIKNSHKTDMHRVHNLIKEYNKDLNDPKIPKKVKEDIKEDLDELNKVVDAYLNSSDDFSNQVNKLILEELEKIDPTILKPDKKDNVKNENVELFEEKNNSEKYQSLTSKEREIVNKRFGDIACSIMKDKDGYFAKTHRCRSKSYPSLEELPIEKVKFVSSTS